MWLVKPKLLCDNHLLGEHLEMHMFAGTIKKKKNIQGYIDKGLVETSKIIVRHNQLAKEMTARGFNHKSPIKKFKVVRNGKINIKANEKELIRRCKKCKIKINNNRKNKA